MKTVYKAQLLQKRKWRIRKLVNGTAVRPRLSVKFSGKHIYAQAVDDDAGKTLVFLSTLDPENRKSKVKGNVTDKWGKWLSVVTVPGKSKPSSNAGTGSSRNVSGSSMRTASRGPMRTAISAR